MNHEASLQSLIDFFQSISRNSVAEISRIYTDDVWFKDPFNEVNGINEVRSIFTHMFDQVGSPRFVVTQSVLQGEHAFLTWDFLFFMKNQSKVEYCIRGATHLRFAPDGRVNFHRDYWDLAEELYEKLPLLGTLMRLLKRAARR